MTEPYVSDAFNVTWRNAGEPWCDKCGLPAKRGAIGVSLHVSDKYPTGVPIEKDLSGHTPSIKKWWDSL